MFAVFNSYNVTINTHDIHLSEHKCRTYIDKFLDVELWGRMTCSQKMSDRYSDHKNLPTPIPTPVCVLPAKPSAAATSLVPLSTRARSRARVLQAAPEIEESQRECSFPRERLGRRGKGGKENWVNTAVVSGEEDLQLRSGVNADGATGHATQSKQNKLGREGLVLGGGGCTSPPGLGGSLGSCYQGCGLQAANL